MKDIKQYFTNGAKTVNEEVATDSGNAADLQQGELEETVTTRKRKRVKIRISRTRDSKERMCDIIESKNDLIDKTPSPFNAKKVNNESTPQDRTPKSRLAGFSTEQRLQKDSKLAAEMNGSQSEKIKNILQNQKLNTPIILDLDDDPSNDAKNIDDKDTSNAELCNEAGSQREESNAFQLLMNRSKPIQYKSPLPQPVEEVELKEKITELKSKRKEKLIALADKKGYSKKKLAELEEGERIEKNIEDRMRVFKGDNKDNVTHRKDENIELPLKNNKQHSGNLLDYFSKSPLKSADKNVKCMSTFTVKADVHRTDNSDIEPVLKPVPNKIYSNKTCSKSKLDLSTADDIHIITSENLFSPQTAKGGKQKREKPRWSLRIKLQSSENNDCANDTTDDELFSPRSRSKLNTSSKSRNLVNTEGNEIYVKNSNGYSKKLRNNEKKESTDKERNVSNTVKDAVISSGDKDVDMCPRKSNTRGRTKQKLNVTSESIVIDDECESINDSVLKRKPNETLAPLFVKRRRTDPAAAAARRLFLQSDMTDVENKSADRKLNNNTFMLPFPAISHVTQLKDKSDSPTAAIKHKFPMKVEKEYSPSINVSNYKCITNYSEVPKATEAISEPVKENVDRVLSEIEKICPDVQRMWNTISAIKGKLKKSQIRGRKSLERKKMLTESIRSDENQSHDCAWTCKYKPTSAQDIVGNEEAAEKLKNWLTSWRTSLVKGDDGSSGDEFYSSDYSSSYNENNQIAVLLGPHGSGKSASVYAIAEELGYSVLEVNASSRRTGKKLLKELEEATKSHRIRKNKHKPLFEQAANKSEEPKILQNSLILLEDIDLIFEEDEGFISAAYQLASNTKRPIVMTSRDTCPHLSKMAPQQNKIYFQRVNGNRVSALLELISLAETGYRIPHNYLMLLQAGDLRQALLQLQYLVMSGPPVLSEQSTTMKSSFWQDVQRYVYKPAVKLSRKQKTKKDVNTKTSNNIVHIMNSLADDLDGVSLVSSLIDVEDAVLNMSKENVQPNLSLAENVSFYSASHGLSVDIASFVSDRILYKNLRVNEYVQNQNIVLRKQLNQEVDLALSHVTSTCLDQRIMALDYLPTARAICRAEESRSTANYKRGNRFFHYLHGLKVPTAFMKPNILAAACKMLQERVDKTALAGVTNVSD
ncbi:uncharacterized protein LOC105279536 isoform X2 [Ooceraea biroi]|uniref:uncharacterized protein LOC105279536 isoform X2 n=1 Tax=Ooceraea biroi TaxID=2015173 RepID=UPI0005BBE170|nr:uncharacterized protein LOC105279536 isoform X2 [Ooceraea biroi]